MNVDNDNNIIFSNMLEVSPESGYSFRCYHGKLEFMSAGQFLFGNTLANVGHWTHVAVVLSGLTATSYIDGQYDASAVVAVPTANNLPETIAASYTPHYFFKGGIDEVRIYNRALSGFEIQELAGVPLIVARAQDQTAETGSQVSLKSLAEGDPPLVYRWFFNGTKLVRETTNSLLLFTSIQATQAGAYTVVVTNLFGAATSTPARLSVIPPVARRSVPALSFAAPSGSVTFDYVDSLETPRTWTTCEQGAWSDSPQLYFDLSTPLVGTRFYRASQTSFPALPIVLGINMVPAITVTGTTGSVVRLDYIDQFGPTDAWFTLATLTLTNTTQLYFDVSAPGRPSRLYRLMLIP